MEAIKKTYQKYKTEYKLSIKHYTNSNIKEVDIKGCVVYPIYVEVTFRRKTTRFRSKLLSSSIEIQKSEKEIVGWSTPDYDESIGVSSSDIRAFEFAIEKDYNLIESIVNYQRSIKEETFSIVDLPRLYHTKYHKLSFFVDWCLKQEIQASLCEINEIDDLGLENTRNHRNSLFPIVDETSSLNNLEYYLIKYTDLISLKQKYNSNTWILDFYLGILVRHDLPNTYWVMGIQNYYADFDVEITILDFKERLFQTIFLNCFQHEQFAKDVLADIEILFIKYINEFNEKFMQ